MRLHHLANVERLKTFEQAVPDDGDKSWRGNDLRKLHEAVRHFAACGGPQSSPPSQAGKAQVPQQSSGPVGPPLATKNVPPIVGQQKTCAGAHEKIFDVDVVETTGVDIGMGMTFAAWATSGGSPACVRTGSLAGW